MDTKELIGEMEAAEDLFSALEVPFDPHVVSAHRMRILRRFGREMASINQGAQEIPDSELRKLYAEALGRIHEQCARGMREPEPVFRGATQQLVQLRRGPAKHKTVA